MQEERKAGLSVKRTQSLQATLQEHENIFKIWLRSRALVHEPPMRIKLESNRKPVKLKSENIGRTKGDFYVYNLRAD